jgi:hypothetical protein
MMLNVMRGGKGRRRISMPQNGSTSVYVLPAAHEVDVGAM